MGYIFKIESKGFSERLDRRDRKEPRNDTKVSASLAGPWWGSLLRRMLREDLVWGRKGEYIEMLIGQQKKASGLAVLNSQGRSGWKYKFGEYMHMDIWSPRARWKPWK